MKIKNGEVKLADVKNNQNNFRLKLNEIKKEVENQKSKKIQ